MIENISYYTTTDGYPVMVADWNNRKILISGEQKLAMDGYIFLGLNDLPPIHVPERGSRGAITLEGFTDDAGILEAWKNFSAAANSGGFASHPLYRGQRG